MAEHGNSAIAPTTVQNFEDISLWVNASSSRWAATRWATLRYEQLAARHRDRQAHRRPDRAGQRGRHRPRQRPAGRHDQNCGMPPTAAEAKSHQVRYALLRVRRHEPGLHRLSICRTPSANELDRPRHRQGRAPPSSRRCSSIRSRPRLPASHQAHRRVL